MSLGNPVISTVSVGWGGAGSLLANTTASVNTALLFGAVQFIPIEPKTINEVWFYVTGVTGTLGASDIRADIYSNSTSGLPNTSSANSAVVSATPTGAAIVKVTGFSLSVTAGVPFWVVLRNAAALPGTNAFTLSEGRAGSLPFYYGGVAVGMGPSFVASTDGGTTWVAASSVSDCPVMVKYADGSFDGLVIAGQAVEASGSCVYAARELGARFTSPAGINFNCIGGSLMVSKSGTPTGNLRYRLYQGTTLVATTTAIAPGDIRTSASWLPLYFSAPVTIYPSTDYRFVAAESSQADTSTNRYNGYLVSIPNDASCKAQKPFNGTLQKTYLNGTWAETDTDIVPFYLFGKELTPALGGLLWPERGN